MNEIELAKKWIIRAHANLEQAKIGVQSEIYFYEDLCFNCQQAAEKAIKAVLIVKQVEYPFIHNIAKLFELVESSSIEVSKALRKAIILTDYAVKTRYSGEYDLITEEDYKVALELASIVIEWAEEIIKNLGSNMD